MTSKTITLPILLLFLSLQCFPQSFMEVSQSTGIEALHEAKNYLGGGVAFVDFDRDGHLDGYVTTGSNGVDHLYHNQGDGTFKEVGTAAGLGITEEFRTLGVITGDVNRDGFPDLFISTWEDAETLHSHQKNMQGSRNLLFLNNQDGTFTEVGEQVGLQQATFTTAATFGDYNLDGQLDLYLGNYIQKAQYSPEAGFQHIGHENLLYLNQGSDANGLPTFVEVGEALGVNDTGCALACTFTDFDNDHDLDLLIANDFGTKERSTVLYRNNYPHNSFTDVSDATQFHTPINGIGIASGDYNEDGQMDYCMSNMGENQLLQNSANPIHSEGFKSLAMNEVDGNSPFEGGKGDENEFTTWGTIFFDYNHDSHLDLFLANGYIPNIESSNSSKSMPNQLYQNQGNGNGFIEIAGNLGLDNTDFSRGAGVGDYDGDGDLDILVANIVNQTQHQTTEVLETSVVSAQLYRNDASKGNWLTVSLEGTENNRDGYGAKVQVMVDGRILMREIDGGSSHLSHSQTIAHFGLSHYTQLEKIEVIWAGGKIQEVLPSETGIFDGKVNQHIHIVEANQATNLSHLDITQFQIRTFPNPFNQQMAIQYHLPETTQVSAAIYDAKGAWITNLLNEEKIGGKHQLEWNGKDAKGHMVPKGTYFCKLLIGGKMVTEKVVYLGG